MYSKTTFFALITTVSLSAVEVAFEPEFPCNRGCQKRIQREFHRALLTQKPSPNSVINSPFDFELNRSQRGYGLPPVCVQRTQKINWKTFVEQEICRTVRNTLPECKYRTDDCVRCFGNGTYIAPFERLGCEVNPIYRNNEKLRQHEICANDNIDYTMNPHKSSSNPGGFCFDFQRMHSANIMKERKSNCKNNINRNMKIGCMPFHNNVQRTQHVVVLAQIIKCSGSSCQPNRRSEKFTLNLPFNKASSCCAMLSNH